MLDNFLSSTDIAKCISCLIARNKLWSNKSVKLYFIINSNAGCFTNKKVSKHYYNLFNNEYKNNSKYKPCTSSIQYDIYKTSYKGHSKEIINNILEKSYLLGDDKSKIIIISAGGDGTSLEVQTALYNSYLKNDEYKNKILNEILVIKLPLGTGNDGTDCNFIGDTFELLKSEITYSNAKVLVTDTKNIPSEKIIKKSSPFISKYCDTKSKSPWYSFNITSIGLDSFICFFTNLVKSKIPGNLYHFCIPICGLFYNRIFKAGTAKIEIFKNLEDTVPSHTFHDKFFLAAIGASGNRTYGGGHKVLPNFNNVCIAKKVPILRMAKENPKFAAGKHVGTDICKMFLAEKIIIKYDQPIMLQCDGECYLLCNKHFPIMITKQNAGFKTLSRPI